MELLFKKNLAAKQKKEEARSNMFVDVMDNIKDEELEEIRRKFSDKP